MPRSLKESLVFTTLMCGLMVLGMSIYNLLIAGHFDWGHVFIGFLPGFMVAFILDWYIVGPLAKSFAFKQIIQPAAKKHNGEAPLPVKVLAISGSMVIGMVTCMSLYGLLINGLNSGGIFSQLSFANYFKTWGLNFIAALPFNLLVVGNISRFILTHFQKWIDGKAHPL